MSCVESRDSFFIFTLMKGHTLDTLLLETAASKATDEIFVIRVSGYLDSVTAEQLEQRIDELMKKGCFRIVVDMEHVSYVSSLGWGVFLSRIKEIRESGGDLMLAAMQPNVFEVFRLLEFELFLNSCDSVEEAVSEFGVTPVRTDTECPTPS